MSTTDSPSPASWRVNDWLKACGHPFARARLYREIARGRITAVKAGRNTLIITSPRDYLMSLPRGVSTPVGRARK